MRPDPCRQRGYTGRVVTSSDNIKLIGQLSTVGLSFVMALVMGFGGGHLLDGWLGTSPWLAFVGFFVGLAAGVLNVYRIMGSIGAKKPETPGADANSQRSDRPPT